MFATKRQVFMRSPEYSSVPLALRKRLRYNRLPSLLVTFCVVFIAVFTNHSVVALETDPYTNRDIDLADSLEILDEKTNAALDEIAASWSRGENERAFITAVYRKLGGRHWVDKLERWAIHAPEIDKLPICRGESVFAGLPFHVRRVGGWGLARIINVNGTYLGTDKLGHFLSQGRKFYLRYQRHGTLENAAKLTARWESFIWGRPFTAIYSNADLVANYEGFLFYQGLFQDGVVQDKVAMFRWEDGQPIRQRQFTWADHVNPFWDEMLNPNAYTPTLLRHIKLRMTRLCDDFVNRPNRYRVDKMEVLRERYRHIGIRDASEIEPSRFLPENCPG